MLLGRSGGSQHIPHISDDPATFKVYMSAGGVLACTDASSEVADGMLGSWDVPTCVGMQ